jgi:hypothetical protein
MTQYQQMQYMYKSIELQLEAVKHLQALGLTELVEEQKDEFLPKWRKSFEEGRRIIRSLDTGVSINVMSDLYDMLSRTYDEETAEHLMGALESDLESDNLEEITQKLKAYQAFAKSYERVAA